ncbi:MAG: hypothetical protein M3Q34_00260 [bacterium]|nr:hypothetical protein [bacterium]
MKQVNQKIKSYSSNVNVVNNNNLRKRAVHHIMVVFFGLALFYILILMNMVWNIVERKALQAQAHDLSNQVGDLELNYLKLSGQVDASLSREMGFREVTPTFAKSSSTLGSIAKATNEI